MKVVRFVRPVSKMKRLELEAQLEEEQERFRRASQDAVTIFREDFSVQRWASEHPVELTMAVMFGGLLLARVMFRQTGS